MLQRWQTRLCDVDLAVRAVVHEFAQDGLTQYRLRFTVASDAPNSFCAVINCNGDSILLGLGVGGDGDGVDLGAQLDGRSRQERDELRSLL